jgi:Immunity protein 53
MSSDADLLEGLENWYQAQCDGDWEHTWGVKIDTLDNPGWTVAIDLKQTNLEGRQFDPINLERADDDWLQAWVEESQWKAACGPLNLRETLRAFLTWARGR